MSPPGGRARAALPLCLALALSVGAVFWTVRGIAPWLADTSNAWHHYEYLAEGFARGHTYLSVDPSPELLKLPDPYDPTANAGVRLWDASLYRGRYYLYYGPAPAVALMVPWRLATGRVLPQNLAVGAFAAAGLAALALIIWEVRRRHFPALGPWAAAFVLVAAFHAAWLPVLLRRPSFWELPIVSAIAFLWWALYFLWKFHDTGGRLRWAFLAGAALALMMGSRVTFVFTAGALVALAFLPARGALRLAAPGWRGLPALGVAFAGGIGLLLYNHARFGRWLEFGQSYQLWGADERHVEHFSLAYAPFNARTYLLSLPSFGPYFPFLHPYWPDAFPKGYIAFEEVYGILFMIPAVAAGLWAVRWAWERRRGEGDRPAVVLVAGAAAASLFSAAILLCWAGACSRYMAELVAGWTVAVSVGLMAILQPAASGGARRAVRAAILAATGWTAACVWLASAEFRGFMRQTNPTAYGAVARLLDMPSDAWARAHGIAYGPLSLVVRVPRGGAAGQTVIVANGRPGIVNFLLLDRGADGRVRFILARNEHHVLETPFLRPEGERVKIRVEAPWLYPPAEHPYWDSVGDPALREDLQTRFLIGFEGRAVATHSHHTADPVTLRPVLQGNDGAAPGEPWVESAVQAQPGG
jgi:hypothetical protein